jgi:hypothetical protein
MNNDEFEKFRTDFNGECTAMLVKKGPDYCHSLDRLENFKEAGREWGVDPLVVWAVYFGKHIAAIRKYVKDRKTSSEPIRGRFMDARNYLDLGLALIAEAQCGRCRGAVWIGSDGTEPCPVCQPITAANAKGLSP